MITFCDRYHHGHRFIAQENKKAVFTLHGRDNTGGVWDQDIC